MRFLTLLIISLLISGCGATNQSQIEQAINLIPADFVNTATVKDDYLDTVATITTKNGFQEKHGLVGIVWNDNFLRAFIDKKTGATTYQLYQIIYYGGNSWNFYQTINYLSPSGPVSAPVTIIDRDVDCSSRGCRYNEHLAFDLDESLIRWIASNYQEGGKVAWPFKFTAKSGAEWQEGLLPAEAAGLLIKVDDYKLRNGL